MDILSLTSLKYNLNTKIFNFYYPVLVYLNNNLNEYVVQKSEEMRLDLVMMSIYDDPLLLNEMDVIIFINDIDNPLNIIEGDIIYYPPAEALSTYRFEFEPTSSVGKNIRKALATPNKTTKKDNNRKKFVDSGYSLPPVVLDESRPPVRLENDKIVIGGLN